MKEAVILILISSFICTLIYFLLALFTPHKSHEWHCRVVTIIHAICIVIASAWCSFIQGPWPFTDAGGPNTYTQVVIVSVSLGYFLFDFTWCLWFQNEGATMLLHHMISIFGMSVALATEQYGTEIVATIFGSEFSNPLLQTRWFLKDAGHYDSIYGDIVDTLFVLSFGVMRFGIGTYFLYTYFQNPRTNLFGRLGGSMFYCVSLLFCAGILQFSWHRVKKKYDTLSGGDDNHVKENGNEKHVCDKTKDDFIDDLSDNAEDDFIDDSSSNTKDDINDDRNDAGGSTSTKSKTNRDEKGDLSKTHKSNSFNVSPSISNRSL